MDEDDSKETKKTKDLLKNYFVQYHHNIASGGGDEPAREVNTNDSKKASVFSKIKHKLASWWSSVFKSKESANSDQDDSSEEIVQRIKMMALPLMLGC